VHTPGVVVGQAVADSHRLESAGAFSDGVSNARRARSTGLGRAKESKERTTHHVDAAKSDCGGDLLKPFASGFQPTSRSLYTHSCTT